MSVRLERMLVSSPDYYVSGGLFEKLLEAQGDEYDTVEAKIADLVAQLRVRTATWGLRYYEEERDIPTIEADSLDVRRGRIIAKKRSPGNFSAALIKSVAESFVNGEVAVTMDFAGSTVKVQFVGPLGIPPNLEDVKDAINDIVHAHLAVAYSFRFLTITDVNALTIDELNNTLLSNFAPAGAGDVV